jgi:hypothetical protein
MPPRQERATPLPSGAHRAAPSGGRLAERWAGQLTVGRRHALVVLSLITHMVLSAASAYATSCRPLQDRYVFACSEASCVPRFRAREALSSQRFSFAPCARRLLIEEFPDWAVSPIQDALHAKIERPRLGAVEVVLERRFHLDAPQNEAALREELQSPRTQLQIRLAPEGEVALRAAFERRSVDELWASRRTLVMRALAVSVIGAILFGSCAWFVRRLRRTPRPRQLRLLGIVLALDTFLFVVALDVPVAKTIGLAAVPLSALVAVIDLATFAVARIWMWGAPDRHRPTI